jgi:hypothetical protein
MIVALVPPQAVRTADKCLREPASGLLAGLIHADGREQQTGTGFLRALCPRLVQLLLVSSLTFYILCAGSQAGEDEPPKQITPLRLLKFGKPELPLVISATFLSAICAFLNMSQNFFVGWLVDIVRFSDLSMRQDQLNWITFVLLAIYIADALLALFSGVLYTIAASRCSCRLRSLVLRNMLRQDVAFFDTVRIGELLNRLSTDTEVIQSVVTSNLVGWFIPSVQVIIGFVICFWYSWQLTLVILSVTPVILIVMFLQGTCMKVLTEQELSALAGAGSKVLLPLPFPSPCPPPLSLSSPSPTHPPTLESIECRARARRSNQHVQWLGGVRMLCSNA